MQIVVIDKFLIVNELKIKIKKVFLNLQKNLISNVWNTRIRTGPRVES